MMKRFGMAGMGEGQEGQAPRRRVPGPAAGGGFPDLAELIGGAGRPGDARRLPGRPPLTSPGSFASESKKVPSMAVKLRLTRVGKTKQPQYRIVAADSRSPRDGRFIEIVGHYNPRTEPSTLTVDNDKAVKWLQQGAQPTDRVRKLLEISGALERVRRRQGRRRDRRVDATRRRRRRRRRRAPARRPPPPC